MKEGKFLTLLTAHLLQGSAAGPTSLNASESGAGHSFGTPTAAVTVTLEGQLSAQKGSLLNLQALSEVLLFYLNLAQRAGQRWGLDTVTSPEVTPPPAALSHTCVKETGRDHLLPQ